MNILTNFATHSKTGREKFPEYDQSRLSVVERIIRDNNYTVGAELGVQTGYLYFHLLETFPELNLYGVDIWLGKTRAQYKQMEKDVLKRAQKIGNRAVIQKMYTNKAVHLHADGSLDFVFIDADHSYGGVKRDIIDWWPKLKIGATMMGHDCEVSGVKRALGEHFDNWETDVDQVWYVRKINETDCRTLGW
jgi:predicted O-methyltransferase YrrM